MDIPAAPTEVVADQRAAGRVSLLLRTAKLVSAAGEYLCILRDVSPGGAKLRLFHPLPEDFPLALELANGSRYSITPIWSDDTHAGFRFTDGPVDIAPLLHEAGRFHRRRLRFTIDLEATAVFSGRDRCARLLNISQDGASIWCERRLALAQPLQICAAGLPLLSARVRWRRGNDHGVAFEHRFGMEDLAQRLAAIHRQPVASITAGMAAR